MIEWIRQPWHWSVSGVLIAFVMFLLLIFGRNFGVSANLRTMCAIGGAGKFSDFFKFDWKSQLWNLVFIVGAVTGGFLASQFLTDDEQTVELSTTVVKELKAYGIAKPGAEIVPEELFSWESLMSVKGVLIIIGGGFLVGFGTRYAGGCTSGHAISGLSDLQLPSLIAVIGFFIGGIIATYFVLPYLLSM